MFDGPLSAITDNGTADPALPTPGRRRRRVAVVGSGIAGLAAAWLVGKRHDVTLFEAGPTVGGHARTVAVPGAGPDGAAVPVDTGFMVFNRRTYPNLIRLFDLLGVQAQASDMSFGVSLAAADVEYAGARDLRKLFAQPRNLARPAYLGMLCDLVRFYRRFRDDAAAGRLADITLGDYLAAGDYGRAFTDWHILPMAAAIWSGSPRAILQFPAATFGNFFRNHGLLDLGDRPQWLTVAGRSRRYVDAMMRDFTGTVRCSAPVQAVCRDAAGVTVKTPGHAPERFDAVVIAAHADAALAMLGDADRTERQILGAFPFQTNRTFLHTDAALMPRRRAVWSSWNVVERGVGAAADRSRPVSVTYWLNRLQSLDATRNIFVSLNPGAMPREEAIVEEVAFRHPQFDLAAVAAQQRLPGIQGRRGVWFAGAWCGYGFHEDGLTAGIAAARGLGVTTPFDAMADPAPHPSPALQEAAA